MTHLSSDSNQWLCTHELDDGTDLPSPQCSPQQTCSSSSRPSWGPRWRARRLSLCRASLRSVWSAWNRGVVGASCSSCPSQWWVMSREDREHSMERYWLRLRWAGHCVRPDWKSFTFISSKWAESQFPEDHLFFSGVSGVLHWVTLTKLSLFFVVCVSVPVCESRCLSWWSFLLWPNLESSCPSQTWHCRSGGELLPRPFPLFKPRADVKFNIRTKSSHSWLCMSVKGEVKAQLLALSCREQLWTWLPGSLGCCSSFAIVFYIPFRKRIV